MANAAAGGLRNVGRRAGEVYLLDPTQIVVEEGFNARDFNDSDTKAHVKELAESIAEIGVQNPIQVRWDGGQVILVNGECRLRATIMAREKTGVDIKIPAVQSKMNEAERIASLVILNEGKQLTPLEQGNVFARLAAYGWSEDEICRKVGKSKAHVTAMLKLYQAPEKIKKLVADGKVAAFNAVHVLRNTDSAEEAYQEMASAVKEAEVKGKTRASATTLKAKAREKRDGTPVYYQRTVVKTMIDALVEIAADTKLNRSLRDRVKDVLENADVSWKDWLKSMQEA